MQQKIAGKFEMTLRGIPFLFAGVTTFESEKGNVTKAATLHLGPLILGLNKRAK